MGRYPRKVFRARIILQCSIDYGCKLAKLANNLTEGTTRMKQLSGMDATFLHMETPETPMHVAGLTMYNLPEGFNGAFHAHFKKSSRRYLE